MTFVGFEPQLKTLTVLEVRISGVFGIGRVWWTGDRRAGELSRSRIGGNCGGGSRCLEDEPGRDWEEEVRPNELLNTDERDGGESSGSDHDARGLVGSLSGAVCLRLKPGMASLDREEDPKLFVVELA